MHIMETGKLTPNRTLPTPRMHIDLPRSLGGPSVACCAHSAGAVTACTHASACRDCHRPCPPTRLIPDHPPQTRQVPRPRRSRVRSHRLLGARSARYARLAPPRALSAIRWPLLHAQLFRRGCASCAPPRRVAFLRRGARRPHPTSSSSAAAAAAPSMAVAAAAAAAAGRCVALSLSSSPLRATYPSSSGAGRCWQRRTDAVRWAARRPAGCRVRRCLRYARAPLPPSLPPALSCGPWRARSPSLPLRSPALLRTELPGTPPVPMPTSGAGAGSLRSEAERSGDPEACAMRAGAAAREAPRGSTLACAQVLGRRISAASPDGARRDVSDMLRAEVRTPRLPRARSPPFRITPCLSRPCSSSRSPATRAACAGRLRVVGGG